MRQLSTVVTFIGGLYFFLFYVLPEPVLSAAGIPPLHQEISNGFIIIGAMAFGVGIINLCKNHSTAVAFQRQGWGYSVALLLGLWCTVGFGIFDWTQQKKISDLNATFAAYTRFFQEHPGELEPGYVESLIRLQNRSRVFTTSCRADNDICQEFESSINRLSSEKTGIQIVAILHTVQPLLLKMDSKRSETSFAAGAFRFCNEALFIPLGSSMFALLAFYIASAVYRAFRIRSIESALLTIAAAFVIIGQTPIGARMWEGFPIIRSWLLEVPNAAAFRGISIGASIAGLVLAVRIWLSMDEA